MKIKNLFRYTILSVLTLGIVIFTAEVALAQELAPLIPNSEDFHVTEFPNLLFSLWFISWLVESLLEIIQKPLKIEDKEKSNKKQWTIWIGFGIGVIIYLSGVHTIGILFDFSEETNNWQKWLFTGVDLILTAAVIAGGSQGIHKLTSAYEEIMQTLKKNTSSQSVEANGATEDTPAPELN